MSKFNSFSVLQTRMSGCIPASKSVFTECCVGFVFSSPAAARNGINVRCMKRALFSSSHFNCLTASINGNASISPTVPPISVITKS